MAIVDFFPCGCQSAQNSGIQVFTTLARWQSANKRPSRGVLEKNRAEDITDNVLTIRSQARGECHFAFMRDDRGGLH